MKRTISKQAANESFISSITETKPLYRSCKDYGVDFNRFSTQAAFLDYDQDGDLDMYLLNHAVHSVRYIPQKSESKKIQSLEIVSIKIFW